MSTVDLISFDKFIFVYTFGNKNDDYILFIKQFKKYSNTQSQCLELLIGKQENIILTTCLDWSNGAVILYEPVTDQQVFKML